MIGLRVKRLLWNWIRFGCRCWRLCVRGLMRGMRDLQAVQAVYCVVYRMGIYGKADSRF